VVLQVSLEHQVFLVQQVYLVVLERKAQLVLLDPPANAVFLVR
jgi:hypothetical protein